MPAPVLQFKRGNAGVAGTVPALRPGEPAFTLNNFDFFVGFDTSVAGNKFFGSHRYWSREDGTNSLRLKLVDRNGSNYVAIKTPNTLAGIVTYTLPGTQGSTGTVLTNDGSGNLSWSSGFTNPVFSGISTFSDTTDNTLGNPDTGAVQIDGGLGVNKNVTIGAGLSAANIQVSGDVNVATAISAPTVKAQFIKSQDGTTAITIASNDITVADDLTVQGNLYVNGSTTQVNTSSLTVEDRTVELGMVDGAAPTSTTTWDLGVLFNYYNVSAKKSAIVWEQGDARFKLGSVVSDSGGSGNNNPQITLTTYAALEISDLWINNTCTGGSSQIIGCVGSELQLQNIVVDAGTF